MLVSKLNQAVLVQFAAVVSLFVVHHPYNLIGLPLLVIGGVLYRRELKRRKSIKATQPVAPSSEKSDGQS
jgi:hypothetical protein